MTPKGWRQVPIGNVVRLTRDSVSKKALANLDRVELFSLPSYDAGREPELVAGVDIGSSKVRVPSEAVLLSKLNPRIPRIWRVTPSTTGLPRVASTEFWPLESAERGAELDLDFLAHHLRSSVFLHHALIQPASSTNSHQRIRRKAFERYPLPLPPLPEQMKIAEILSSVDEAIAATRKVIEQTERVKKGLLQTLMTRGIGHTRFKQTEIGEIPETWTIVPVNAVCSTISVGIVVRPAALYVDFGVPCIRSANITPDGIKDEKWVYISPESHAQHSKSRIEAGDVVVVRTGDPGKACVVPPHLDNCNAVDIVFARPDPKEVEPGYLAHFLNSEEGRRQVLRRSGGLAQKHLNVGALKTMTLPLPEIPEQRRIVSVVDEVSETRIAMAECLTQLQHLKRGLLQDLLTGRVRVPVD